MKPPPSTWVDRLVGVFDPQAELARRAARARLQVLDGGYVGGDVTRRSFRTWGARARSADADTLPQLTQLRAHSRDLVRNNALAGGAVAGLVTGVVGTGLAVQPAVDQALLRLTPEQASAWQRQAKALFELWASRADWCDVTGQLDFYALQGLAFLSELESGDCFATLPELKVGSPIGFAVQLIEADRICNPGGKPDDLAGWAGGIRCNAAGRPERVAIAQRHPGGYNAAANAWSEVEVWGGRTRRRNVLQLVDVNRINLRRGVPYLAPVMEPLKQLGTYTDAEIQAAVISGMFTVFVTSEGADAGATASATAGAATDIELEGGGIFNLLPGEKIETANPGRPNSAFDPFVQAIVRQIAMRLEQPYEVLLKHYTSSYTAARAAFLDAYRMWRRRRARLAAQFCQPIYEAALLELVVAGRLRAPGFLRDPLVRAAYCRADWIGDAHGSLDPVKDASAARERISLGISTRADETVAYSGRNWEDVHAQLAREQAARREAGLDSAPAASAAAPSEPAPTPDPEDQDAPGPARTPSQD